MVGRAKRIHVGILCALPDIELTAIARAFDFSADKEDELIDGNRYWFASIKSERCQKKLNLVITAVGTAGNVDAGAATVKLIQIYNPELLCFVGIAAGLEDKLNLVDVVVSEKVIGYELGRLTPDGMQPRPDFEHPPYNIMQDVRFFGKKTDQQQWLSLFDQLQGLLTDNQAPASPIAFEPKAHFASIASGEKLFADGSLVEIRKIYDEKICAGEMEGIGFAKISNQHRKPWLVIRGISDFGNPATKDGRLKDKFHYSAANAAASWLKTFIQCGYSGDPELQVSRVSDFNNNLCEDILNKIRGSIASHGLDDETWAKAISSQYFLVALAKNLELTEQKDYLNLLNIFLSSFHRNVQNELVLHKEHILITPEETDQIMHFMKEEDEGDDHFRKSEKMKAENIDAWQMYNNYHYGLTLLISASETIQVLDEIKTLSLDKLIKSDSSLDEYGGWYPYRVPWITARVLISLRQCSFDDRQDSNEIDIIVKRALESLIRRVYKEKYWRSGVGAWVSKWESTALCLEALDKWDYVEPNKQTLRKVLRYVIDEEAEWKLSPPDFSNEELSNKTLSSIVLTCVLLRIISNNFEFEDFSLNPTDYLNYLQTCVKSIADVSDVQVRQFCTIPQITFYIADAVNNYIT